MLIYIHGFNSSSGSGKARELQGWMEARGLGEAYACPDLPHRPSQAIALLEELIHRSRGRAKLVGSSMGGFYATWLAERHGLKAVLVNPAVNMHRLIASEVGKEQKNWHSDESWLFTQSHADEFAALHLPRPRHPENLLLLVETGDEVLDHRLALDYYAGARQEVCEGGDHGFTRFADYLPAIMEF